MALGDALQKRMEELAKREAALPRRFREIAENATLQAVEEAVTKTPSLQDGKLRGVHTITGELAQHWRADSQTVPARTEGRFTTTLENNQQYASFVNDGHQMDRHPVRGLYIDDSGLLSYDPARNVYLMVGTRTKYVPGIYMKEAGIEKYKEAAEIELKKLAEEAFQ